MAGKKKYPRRVMLSVGEPTWEVLSCLAEASGKPVASVCRELLDLFAPQIGPVARALVDANAGHLEEAIEALSEHVSRSVGQATDAQLSLFETRKRLRKRPGVSEAGPPGA